MTQFNKKAVKPVLIAAVLFTLPSQLVIMFESAATMDIYLMPEYFPVWSRLMMPDMGPPPATFFALSILVSFALALIDAAVFWIMAPGIPGEGIKKGGVIRPDPLFSIGCPLTPQHVSAHQPACKILYSRDRVGAGQFPHRRNHHRVVCGEIRRVSSDLTPVR